jgi:hypothetical protein
MPVVVVATPFTIGGAMVEVDGVSVRLIATASGNTSCMTTYDDVGVDVVETDAEVRMAARGIPVPVATVPGVTYGCTGGPYVRSLDVRLAAPLGGRSLLDAHAGDVVRPVLRSELLVPTSLPDGWVGTEEQFGRTATGARWSQRFQPSPLPVMVYGLDVQMTWGGDCRAEFDAAISTAPSLTPVTVRGIDGEQTNELHGPRLFCACVQVWGLGSCRSSAGGCFVIDRAQLMALVETLAPVGS